MKKIKKFLKSFTLIELIIVIAIIAILGGVAFLLLSQYLAKSRDSRKVTDINALSKALVIYDIQYGGFPLPSRAIGLTDEYGQEIGKQGLFDAEVFKQLSSLAKVVKDPFTDDYYGYTRYDNNRGFEIGTFFEVLKPYSIRSYIYAQEVETKPYVYVYGDLGFCDENGELTNPKPISVYDTDRPEYVSQKNMGMNGKIMYNLKYLFGTQETGTGNCASEISAPIVAITSVNDTQNIKNTVQKPLIDPVSGVQEGIQEVCTHISPTGQSLCNTPDIYRISYTKNILIYELGNGEIYVVEMEYDPGTDKFLISEEKSIYNGGGTSTDKGTVYGVYPTGAGGYEIYYGGGNGGVVVYSEGVSGGTGSVLVGGTTTLGGGASTATSGGGTAAGGAVITYGESATNKGYITYVESTGGTPVVKTSELPFECKMPKIINVNQDEYIVMYIGTDGKIHYNKVKLSSSGDILSEQEIIVSGQEILAQEIYEIQKVWPGVYMIFYKTNTGEYRINVVNENGTGFECNGVGELVDTTMDSYEIVYLGGGRVQVLYKKGTSTYLKEYNISEEGVLTAITEANGVYECADMQMLDLDPTKTTLICKTATTVSMSSVKDNSPIVTLNTEGFANVGDTRQTTCTKPSNAVYNTLTQITQTYDGENWLPSNVGVYSETGSTSECKFKCEDGFEYINGTCQETNSIENSSNLLLGNRHVCSYNFGYDAYCWGTAGYYQMGIGSSTRIGQQAKVIERIGQFKTLTTSRDSTCGIDNNNKLYCWGRNSTGNLGNGTKTNISSPFPIDSSNDYKMVSSRQDTYAHTCGITLDGDLYCWGDNSYGELGNGNTTESLFPTPIDIGNKYIQVSVGADFTCGIRSDNKLYCGGKLNSKLTPFPIDQNNEYKIVSSGGGHVCGIRSDNKLNCWGQNGFGQLGIGNYPNNIKTEAELVDAENEYIDIATGGDHTCGIRVDNKVYCWGSNSHKQLGQTLGQYFPNQIDGEDLYKKVKAGGYFSCGITIDDKVKCWGYNFYYQLGIGNNTYSIQTPTQVLGFE